MSPYCRCGPKAVLAPHFKDCPLYVEPKRTPGPLASVSPSRESTNQSGAAPLLRRIAAAKDSMEWWTDLDRYLNEHELIPTDAEWRALRELEAEVILIRSLVDQGAEGQGVFLQLLSDALGKAFNRLAAVEQARQR